MGDWWSDGGGPLKAKLQFHSMYDTQSVRWVLLLFFSSIFIGFHFTFYCVWADQDMVFPIEYPSVPYFSLCWTISIPFMNRVDLCSHSSRPNVNLLVSWWSDKGKQRAITEFCGGMKKGFCGVVDQVPVLSTSNSGTLWPKGLKYKNKFPVLVSALYHWRTSCRICLSHQDRKSVV